MLSSPLERDKSLKAAAAKRYDDTTTTITTDGESVRTVEAWNAMLEWTRTEEEEEEEEKGCVTRTRGRMMGRERSECGDRQAARRTFSTLDSKERENDRNEWPNLALSGGEGGGEGETLAYPLRRNAPTTHIYTYTHTHIHAQYIYIYRTRISHLRISSLSSSNHRRSRYFSSTITSSPLPAASSNISK